MSYKIFKLIISIVFISAFLSACGSDSGDSGSSTNHANAKFVLQGVMPSGLPVAGIQMTLHFPPGVVAEIDPATGDVSSSTIRLVGAADPSHVFVAADYLPATATEGGEITFLVTNLDGFELGDFLSLSLIVSDGVSPAVEDFYLTDASVSDTEGHVLDNLQPVMTVTIE